MSIVVGCHIENDSRRQTFEDVGMSPVLIVMLFVAGLTGVAILGGSIYRKDGKFHCLLFQTESQGSKEE